MKLTCLLRCQQVGAGHVVRRRVGDGDCHAGRHVGVGVNTRTSHSSTNLVVDLCTVDTCSVG